MRFEEVEAPRAVHEPNNLIYLETITVLQAEKANGKK